MTKDKSITLWVRKATDMDPDTLRNTTISINLVDPPENLEAITKAAFSRYTQETNPEFVDTDKLGFIDLLRKKIHPDDFDGFRTQCAHDSLDYALDNGVGFNLDEDVDSDIDFAVQCFNEGFKPLEYRDSRYNHHDIYKIHHALVRMIKAVMEWREEDA